ncbi:Galactokinase [Lunatimonas lonarensis]|uniref:Galactokinase n=1 Tax=Lunatimonas lonarensis TaxID=1232681 RepID=R7ZSG2_9BACT|nr:galactokinase [Lunatimonas lonarensis]EON76988.1 Galactokinase [Lunatimonas lonarensis]
MLGTRIQSEFSRLFGTVPLMIASPGRINLIGEHTDYNGGFVLPAAIDKSIYFGFAKNNTRTARVYSLDYKAMETFELDERQPREKGWINFILGVTVQLQRAGHPVEGFDCVFGGDIPIGAGLSSSAALENGVGMGLSELFELEIPKQELILHSQRAEHEFAGVKCGIMDMFASMMGRKGHALRLDCRSLDFAYFPLSLGGFKLVLLDTRVEHSLGDSAYNTRREECRQGVEKVASRYPQVRSLRDVSLDRLNEVKQDLPGKVYDRCRYVIAENQRVLKSCELLAQGDLAGFGREMYSSHDGLSGLYEVSCPELDFLVAQARENPHVLGARMMGGGFGGCTLNLVASDQVDAFVSELYESYERAFGIALKSYVVATSDGTRRLF